MVEKVRLNHVPWYSLDIPVIDVADSVEGFLYMTPQEVARRTSLLNIRSYQRRENFVAAGGPGKMPHMPRVGITYVDENDRDVRTLYFEVSEQRGLITHPTIPRDVPLREIEFTTH
ncbi:MAG: hypothetical protein AABW61_01210 [Candidatus Aenigmatarchaeota archaeon]